MEKLLEIRNISKLFPISRRGTFLKKTSYLQALHNVSLTIGKGETLGLVGESGCGKSTLARTIVRLHEPTSGEIYFENEAITHVNRKELNIKRRNIQIIFQDPFASLNPRLTIGEIISEPLFIYRNRRLLELTNKEIRQRAKNLLDTVGLAEHHYNLYPHEFSGGQRQRIGIARALALRPKLILCDEPVSALDVSIQAQIINLLQDLQQEFSLTYLFISHDLSVVRHISDRVAVMYLGRLIELAGSREIYTNPLHPYTKALLSSVPIADPVREKSRKRIILDGELSGLQTGSGRCCFYNRCPVKKPACLEKEPELLNKGQEHYVSCLLC